MADLIDRIRNRIRQFRWNSLAIVLGSLIVVLLSDAFVGYILWNNYRETVRSAEAENNDLARVLEKYVLSSIQGVDLILTSTLRAVETTPDLRQQGSQRLIELLQARIASYPSVSNLAVIDAVGNVIANTRGDGTPGKELSVADRPYYLVFRNSPGINGLYIDIPRHSRITGQLVIAVARAITKPDGSFGGVVSAALTVESVNSFLRVVNVGADGLVTLFRDDGVVLARVPTGDQVIGETIPNQRLFTTYLPRAAAGSFEGFGNSDGNIRHLSYRRVEGLPLVISVARSRGEFLAEWNRQTWTMVIMAGFLNLLVVGLGMSLARETSRRESFESSVIEQERLIHLVADNVPMLIAYVDKNLTYRFVNRVAAQWMKHPISDFIGRAVSDLLPSSLFERARPRIDAALRGINVGFEEKRIYGDGVERWADVTYIPVMEKDREVIGYIVLVADISGRKRAETRLREHEEQLRQAQKMEVVGQLTGGVAHDFNNLLGVILGNLDLLDATLGDRPEEKRILQRAIDAVERGGSLTRQLLAFSRKQMLLPQSIDVDHLLIDIAALLRRTLGESVEVSTTVTPGLWHCRADRTQLETALLNLSLNARDAMPKGGKVTIDASNFAIDQAYAAQFAEVVPGDYVVIAVTDSGTGMTAEVAERAFEPFFTTKEVGKGSGLGLSMVYGFVKQSGGHVRLYSEPGVGTSVKLFLPRASEGEAKVTPTVETMARGQGQLILVVEDNMPLRQVAVISLHNLGYATLEAGTVAAAIELLEQNPNIALLFTDIVLPGGRNGFELAEEVRLRWPKLKILFASGHPNVAQSEEAIAAGAVIMPKPFRIADLARHVRAMLDS